MSEGERRVAAVIGGVVRQALHDSGSAGVILVDDAGPEAQLLLRWCRDALGTARVHVAAAPDPLLDALLALPAVSANPEDAVPAVAVEARRAAARVAGLREGLLAMHPINRTALLLGGRPPAEPLLPLGDLAAGRIERLAGGCTLPPDVRLLADAAGGLDRLEEALERLLDERRRPDEALASLPDDVARSIRERLRAGRFWRRRCGLVPKLGPRTVGTDLHG